MNAKRIAHCVGTLFLCLDVSAQDPLPDSVLPLKQALDKTLGQGKLDVLDCEQKYRAALAGMQQKAQAAGDLDLLLLIKQKLESTESAPAVPNKYRELLQLDAAYRARRTRLHQAQMAREKAAWIQYGKQLTHLQAELTRANQIDAALAVKKEVDRARAALTQLQVNSASGSSTPDGTRGPEAGGLTGKTYPPKIPKEARRHNNQYYFVYNEAKSWSEALRFCQERGGTLVCLSKREKHNYVLKLIASQENPAKLYWTGGHRPRNDVKGWRWTNQAAFKYTNWGEQEPDNNSTDGETSIGLAASGHWADIAPWRELPFVCEWDNPRRP